MGNIKKTYFTFLKIIPILLLLVSCSSTDKTIEKNKTSDIKMYKNGLLFLENSDYGKALVEILSKAYLQVDVKPQLLKLYMIISN